MLRGEKADFNTCAYFYEAKPNHLGGISFSGDLTAVIREIKPHEKRPSYSKLDLNQLLFSHRYLSSGV